MRGSLFITFEGIEGVGKTSHVGFVSTYLRDRGHQVVQTREPGGTELGEGVRALLLDNAHAGMSADTELLLIFAARAEHIVRIIRPALKTGCDVVCDRFTDATYAYQGGGRSIPLERIALLESFVQQELRPDLTFLLDAPVNVALARANNRGSADRFESETMTFFERVRSVYIQRAAEDQDRFRIIDASLPLGEVRLQIAAVLDRVLT